MAEPFFIAQNGECTNDEDARNWFKDTAAEAKAKGATECRFTHGCAGHPNLLLVEAWDIPVKDIGDQGYPRFQLTRRDSTSNTGGEV